MTIRSIGNHISQIDLRVSTFLSLLLSKKVLMLTFTFSVYHFKSTTEAIEIVMLKRDCLGR